MEELVKHIKDQIKEIKDLMKRKEFDEHDTVLLLEIIKDYEAQLRGYMELLEYSRKKGDN